MSAYLLTLAISLGLLWFAWLGFKLTDEERAAEIDWPTRDLRYVAAGRDYPRGDGGPR